MWRVACVRATGLGRLEWTDQAGDTSKRWAQRETPGAVMDIVWTLCAARSPGRVLSRGGTSSDIFEQEQLSCCVERKRNAVVGRGRGRKKDLVGGNYI